MSYQIEFRHLYYFKTLAEELHFRKAAEKLFISQPGLSRQIKQMEMFYGLELFDRSKRTVKLTKAGIFLKQESDKLLHQWHHIENQLQQMAVGKFTRLKLGFIGSAAQNVIPEILYTLKHKQPQLEISLDELPNSNQTEALLNLELDLGIVRMKVPPAGLSLLKLMEESFSLVVPKNHAIQAENFKSLAAFKHEDFILFSNDYSNAYYELVMSLFSDAGFQPQGHHRTVNALSIFKLVEKGMGVAIVPSALKEGYDVEVSFIPLAHLPQRSSLSLLWNAENRNPGIPAVLEVVRALYHSKEEKKS